MPLDFDDELKLITLDSDTGDAYTIEEIYSDWKEWVQAGVEGHYAAPAFVVEGGSPITDTLESPTYFFLTNDWRIKPREASHSLTLTGNVFVDPNNPDTAATVFALTTGSFQVDINQNKSDQSILTKQSIRDAMAIGTTQAAEIGSIDKKVDRTDQNTQPAP